MASLHRGAYTRRLADMTMWHEFDALAARMKLSMSGLLARAAAEYVENHRHDPPPEKPVPNARRRRRIDHDPS